MAIIDLMINIMIGTKGTQTNNNNNINRKKYIIRKMNKHNNQENIKKN